ncbi:MULTISPECIES: L,D-transpeptidase [unclassified Streptomyces]|uniref:Ig-like domain-containing protein n=1 Tax=Streptomyces sp. R33 TaxID=3238629 RepID=A0AB39Y935_9ACTN|nr:MULTISPECIES: Ig-like domain-containing protein [unclassified Streptomyces]KOY59389.1 lipoprotein [Streptomyces sp. XY332]THA38767.1 L,D-transpeptidase [Streptomyces sp. A1547]
MKHSPRLWTVLSCSVLVASLGAGATACGPGDNPLSARPYDAGDKVVFNQPPGGRPLDPEKPLEITAKGTGGTRITDVSAVDSQGRRLAGELSAKGDRWHSTAPMAAGAHYTVLVNTEDERGAPGQRRLTFKTTPAKQVLKVEFGPDEGKYGVGQPITAELNEPITDKAARAIVERGLVVDTPPGVEGAWHWVDDKHLHFRPKEYWPAHSTVSVRSNLEGIKISDELHGAVTKPLNLEIGDRVEVTTDASSHYLTFERNGEVINTIPVTTGKPGFSTRNGVKVVLGKQYFVQMRGDTVGIGGSEYYNLPVYYATRVTWSGEYVHAAPWSVGSQGYENVSHGCTGMSTGNAAWFYENITEGDIVRVINSIGDDMEPFGNGFGDWNLDWKEWREGSALLKGTQEGRSPIDKARLRPTV